VLLLTYRRRRCKKQGSLKIRLKSYLKPFKSICTILTQLITVEYIFFIKLFVVSAGFTLYVPSVLTISNTVFYMYVRIVLTLSVDYFLKEHQPVDVCNGKVRCSLWVTDWIIKCYVDERQLQRVNFVFLAKSLCYGVVTYLSETDGWLLYWLKAATRSCYEPHEFSTQLHTLFRSLVVKKPPTLWWWFSLFVVHRGNGSGLIAQNRSWIANLQSISRSNDH
jgi:hypothetical protein